MFPAMETFWPLIVNPFTHEGAGHCRTNLRQMPRRRGNESVTGIVSLNPLGTHVRRNNNLFIVLVDLFVVNDFFLCG